MRFFEKTEDQVVVKFDHGRLVLASIGAALFVALVFLMGVLVGKALWSHPAGSILATTAEQIAKPPASDEPRISSSKLDFYTDVKKTTDEVPQTEMKARLAEEKPAPTPVTPTVPPPVMPLPPPQAAQAEGEAKPAPPPKAAPAAKPALPTPRTLPTVTTAAPAKPVPTAPAQTGKAGYALQIESYQEKGKAEAARKKLSARGINTEISLSTVNGVSWYRLQAAGFPTREAAEKYNREVLKPKGYTGYLISR